MYKESEINFRHVSTNTDRSFHQELKLSSEIWVSSVDHFDASDKISITDIDMSRKLSRKEDKNFSFHQLSHKVSLAEYESEHFDCVETARFNDENKSIAVLE